MPRLDSVNENQGADAQLKRVLDKIKIRQARKLLGINEGYSIIGRIKLMEIKTPMSRKSWWRLNK